jgi:nitroimidazol reductase NimA-like FMN-containing flavoprotein (pyridoxamine 5'-phosphate oxidase superfamily)
MSGPQKETFLETENTGVLSVPVDEDTPPYSIPVSFAFDPDRNRIVFQFINHPESTKMQFIEEGTAATLTVVDRLAGTGWISETVTGTMGRLSDDETTRAARRFDDSTDGSVNVFPDRDDYHTEWWCLVIQDEHGRHSKTHGVSVAD